MDSSSSTNLSQERDTHLLSVGKQCSHSTCNLVDFLPFKCHHCQQSFCQEHFKVEAHKCPQYDERKHDRIAPNCPLCNTPISVKIGQDPNIVMDSHLEKDCSVVTGRVKPRNVPVCARVNCQKVLIVPMQCQSCRKSFCTNHRFPDDHYCSSKAGSSAPSKSSTPNSFANFNAGARSLNTKATAAGTVAMDAMKKSITTTAIPAARNALSSVSASASASTSTSTPSSSKPPLPFSKMDRRARAERESKLKSMQARAKKGLLSEEEKAILASEEAAAQDKKDCIIM